MATLFCIYWMSADSDNNFVIIEFKGNTHRKRHDLLSTAVSILHADISLHSGCNAILV